MIPDGYLARWRGRDHEASPDGGLVRLYRDEPAEGFDPVGPRRYVRLVAADEVDWFGYLRTVAIWRGQPVVLIARRGNDALVEYLGGRGPAALALGMDRADIAVYRGWAPLAELTDVRQERIADSAEEPG
ncbi:MAG: hypothetical protein WCA46_31505 [Actinocatenispora sp.]